MEITLQYADMKTILNTIGGLHLYTTKSGGRVARVYPWIFGGDTVYLPDADLLITQFTADYPTAMLVEKIA